MLLAVFLAALLQGSISFAIVLQDQTCTSKPEDLTVTTSNGPIIGHIAPSTSCVLEFLGIPYAKPPIGELRFSPPQRITTVTSDPYEASKFGLDCPLTPSKPVTGYPGFTPQAQRIINYFASAAGTPQSEDCLTLNIWTRGPIPDTADANSNLKSAGKPVLVFFYGGRFTIGNTNTPFYNGKHFAQAQDIIIVTVNYRLNIFGFPVSTLTNIPQNLGLRDQRLAVEWIRDNIRTFGGDPSKITISGQSSGGVSVDYWAYAYRHDPIVHGIIAHSGNTFSFPANTKAIQQSNWEAVVQAVNCSHPGNTSTSSQNPTNTEILNCMRTIPYQALLSAASSLKPTKSSSILRSIPPFWPTPDNEIVFNPSEYLSLTANGSFAKIPILLGNTHNENGYYQVAAFASQGILPTEEQVNSFLLESFTCPVAYQASARRRFGVPAYVYRYFADWEITRMWVDDKTGKTSGAYHGVDLHMLFGAAEEVSGLVGSDEEVMRRRALTRLMQRAWFVFADDPVDGLDREFGWPEFDAGGEKTLAVLGVDNKAEMRFEDREIYDKPCGNVTMGALGSVG